MAKVTSILAIMLVIRRDSLAHWNAEYLTQFCFHWRINTMHILVPTDEVPAEVMGMIVGVADHLRIWIHLPPNNDSLIQPGDVMVLRLDGSPGSHQWLQRAHEQRAFCHNCLWLLHADETLSLAELDFLTKLDLLVDSDVILTMHMHNGDHTLHEVYKMAPDLPLRYRFLGHWRGHQLHLLQLEYKYQRRSDMEGINLDLITPPKPPVSFVQHSHTTDGTAVLTGGFYGDLLLSLQESLNFTYTLHFQLDGMYGSLEDDGWNGMVGSILEGKAQMVVADLTITSLRATVIDFTIPVLVNDYRLYVKRAADTEFFSGIYLLPYRYDLWILFILFIPVLAFSLHFIHYVLKPLKGRWNLGEELWMFFSCFCQQGAPVLPDSNPARMLCWSGFLLYWLCFCGYSGLLTSYLAFHDSELPIHQIEDLLHMPGWSLGFLNTGLMTTIFRFSQEGSIRYRLWHEKVAPRLEENLVPDVTVGMNKVVKEHFAFLVSHLMAEEDMGALSCVVGALSSDYFIDNMALGLTKESPYRRLFNYHILKQGTTGLQSRRYLRWIKTATSCPPNSFSPVDINEAKSLFLFLFVGIILSLAIVALEFQVRRRHVRLARRERRKIPFY